MTNLMREPRRLVRSLVGLGVFFWATLLASVSIFASSTITPAESAEVADAPADVGGAAVAKKGAARTGVTVATEDPPPPTPPPPPPIQVTPEGQRVLDLVNAERTARGLQPVTLDQRLVDASQQHSAHQAQVGTIFHTAPDGTTPGDRIAATGYSFSAWAENVAAGQSTPESVVRAWMESEGHCRNILNPGYTELGVGYVRTEGGFRHWWTQKFARESGAPVPPGTYDPAWC